MNRSKIEWLQHPTLGPGMTWNPLAMQCTRVGPGCDNCWHLAFANRLAKNPSFSDEVRAAYAGGAPVMRKKELAAPLHRRKPTMIAVQLMGDLFHKNVPNEFIAAIYGVMAACPQHIFVVLTKRPRRAVEWYEWVDRREIQGLVTFPHDPREWRIYQMLTYHAGRRGVSMPPHHGGLWPLPNVWIGVTAEDQPRADERIPLLLQILAAVRFVSVEPMLSDIDFVQAVPCCDCGEMDDNGVFSGCRGGTRCDDYTWWARAGIHWVICGGETGPGARPMKAAWALELKDQCVGAGVPFFFKKWGPVEHGVRRITLRHRELDGRTWEEFPG